MDDLVASPSPSEKVQLSFGSSGAGLIDLSKASRYLTLQLFNFV